MAFLETSTDQAEEGSALSTLRAMLSFDVSIFFEIPGIKEVIGATAGACVPPKRGWKLSCFQRPVALQQPQLSGLVRGVAMTCCLGPIAQGLIDHLKANAALSTDEEITNLVRGKCAPAALRVECPFYGRGQFTRFWGCNAVRSRRWLWQKSPSRSPTAFWGPSLKASEMR